MATTPLLTTTATVTPEGLALPSAFMAEHDLTPGTCIVVTLREPHRATSPDKEKLIREARGMFADSGGRMAEELQAQRREDERRFQEKW